MLISLLYFKDKSWIITYETMYDVTVWKTDESRIFCINVECKLLKNIKITILVLYENISI